MNLPFVVLAVCISAITACSSTIGSSDQSFKQASINHLQKFDDEHKSLVLTPLEAAAYFLNPLFSTIDCEAQGVIEDGDVDEHFSSLFFYNDRDQSRSILQSEFLRARPKESEADSLFVFTLMDSNGDKIVDPREYRQYISVAIKTADKDNNGELYYEELVDAESSDYTDADSSRKKSTFSRGNRQRFEAIKKPVTKKPGNKKKLANKVQP